jgi:hypothetical protein
VEEPLEPEPVELVPPLDAVDPEPVVVVPVVLVAVVDVPVVLLAACPRLPALAGAVMSGVEAGVGSDTDDPPPQELSASPVAAAPMIRASRVTPRLAPCAGRNAGSR